MPLSRERARQPARKNTAAGGEPHVDAEQLRFIALNAPTSLAHIDRKGRLLFVNNAFAARWNKRPEDFIGRHASEFAIPSAMMKAQPFIERVLAGERVEFEAELDYVGLGRRYMRLAFTPELGPDGMVRGYLSTATDLTERWRAEQALRESEERVRLATRSGKLGIWSWDVATNRMTWSESLYELHGVTAESCAPTLEGFLALVHPEERGPVGRAVQSALEHDVPYELEFRAVRPGGGIVWVLASGFVFRDAAGKPVRMLGTTLDITARKTAELALRAGEKRFRALAGHAPVGIFLTDPQGETLFVNESWCAMTGLTPSQARGRGWTLAVHPEDRPRVVAEWEAAQARGQPARDEYRFLRADGGVTWVQGNALPLKDDAGRPAGYIGTLADFTERKLIEDQLRAHEAQLRVVTTNAPVSLAHADCEGRFLFANRAYADRFGLEPGQIIGRPIAEVIGAEAFAILQPFIERVLAGEAFTCEVEVPYRQLGRRFMRVSYAPDFGADGQVRGWLAALTDLTERRRTENAVRENEERFRQLADSMPQIVFAADAQGRTDYYNRRWYELTGRQPGETGDESFLPALHPDDRQRCLDAWHRCVATGEPYQIEYRFRFAAQGEYRWHLGRALPARDATGRIVRWFGTCTDISELRGSQMALRKQNERLQLISEALAILLDAQEPAQVVHELLPRVAQHVDADCYFNYMIEPAGGVLTLRAFGGILAEAAAGLARLERGPIDVPATGWGFERAALVAGFGVRAYACNPFMAGNRLLGTLSFGSRSREHFAPDELEFMRSISRYVALALDRAGVQAQLQAHASELEHRVHERTASLREAIVQMEEFSYSVSHDLRAPLRAMNAYAQALAEDYGAQLDATARGYLEKIQRSSARMERLTHDVLTYSRIARGEIQLGPIDLKALVRDLISHYAELQPPAADVEIGDELHRVRGHEVSLGQCLGNLLTNAAKFVPPGVRPRIRVRTEPAGEHVRVWVEDNGIGVPPYYHERLFRVFERVPTPHTYDGTGIGLAIVRKAAEKMGGRCGVESDGVNGSRFWIELRRD